MPIPQRMLVSLRFYIWEGQHQNSCSALFKPCSQILGEFYDFEIFWYNLLGSLKSSSEGKRSTCIYKFMHDVVSTPDDCFWKVFKCWHWNWTSSLLFPSYRESAKRVSKSIKQLPRAPVQEAADWVEYTQVQGGLQYLRPRGLDLPFYQLHLLDILLLKFIVVVSAFVIVRFLFRFVKSENKVVKTKEKAT